MNWSFKKKTTNGPAPSTNLKLPGSAVSIEVISNDERSLAQLDTLPPGIEVFVASLPREGTIRLAEACARIREQGLIPVPHLVARNLVSTEALVDLLHTLSRQAGVDRALVLGGDRADPLGPYPDALSLLTSGLLEKSGLEKVFLACYPEGHPRIPEARLWASLEDKINACRQRQLQVELVSQFCFDPTAILRWAAQARSTALQAPFRLGVAGPASTMKLMKYALLCGIGPSLRMLNTREGLMKNMMTVTPTTLLNALQEASLDPPLSGVHVFTFGDVGGTANWLKKQRLS